MARAWCAGVIFYGLCMAAAGIVVGFPQGARFVGRAVWVYDTCGGVGWGRVCGQTSGAVAVSVYVAGHSGARRRENNDYPHMETTTTNDM